MIVRYGRMCGILATCVIAAVISTVAVCSARAASLRAYGVKVGYMASGFTWDADYWPAMEQGRRSGFGVTVFGEWFDYHAASIRAGVSYSQRGGTLEWVNPNAVHPPEIYTDDLRIDYLTVSLLLKLRHETRVVFPYICAGPHVDFLLEHQHWCESDDDDRPCGWKPLTFPAESYESVVYGFSASAGLEFPSFAPIPFFLEFSYERSLSTAIEGPPPSTTEEAEAGYECFNLFVGVAF